MATKTKAAPAKSSAAADKLWAQYCEKPDRELLRVYADALAQAGDPRGTFINLCLLDAPTAEQQAAKQTMMSKQKKLLAGPGGAFLREFEFGPDGLVSQARTEAGQVIGNEAALAALNPKLLLTITSITTQKDAQAFAKADLGDIYFVDFGWITGTHGGMRMPDKILDVIGPALANVRHLQLGCSGSPEKCFTPAALRALGPKLKKLRYLAIQFYPDGLPPAADYAKAVTETFPKTLRAFEMDGVTEVSGLRVTNLLEHGRTKLEAREFVAQIEAAVA